MRNELLRIAGEKVAGHGHIEVRNPYNDAVVGTVPKATLQQVREGRSLHEALETTGVVADLAVDMVKVGEATGSLDVMLSNVSDFLDEEVEVRMQRILSLVEPLMLIVMGTIVALLLVSVYLPMFSALGRMQ